MTDSDLKNIDAIQHFLSVITNVTDIYLSHLDNAKAAYQERVQKDLTIRTRVFQQTLVKIEEYKKNIKDMVDALTSDATMFMVQMGKLKIVRDRVATVSAEYTFATNERSMFRIEHLWLRANALKRHLDEILLKIANLEGVFLTVAKTLTHDKIVYVGKNPNLKIKTIDLKLILSIVLNLTQQQPPPDIKVILDREIRRGLTLSFAPIVVPKIIFEQTPNIYQNYV